jgi:hypothetical protein
MPEDVHLSECRIKKKKFKVAAYLDRCEFELFVATQQLGEFQRPAILITESTSSNGAGMDDNVANKTRLLVLTSTFPRWENDPEPAFVYKLSRRLADKFSITVLVPRSPGAKDEEVIYNSPLTCSLLAKN